MSNSVSATMPMECDDLAKQVPKECVVKLTDVAAGFKRKFDEIADKKKKHNRDDSRNQSPGNGCKRNKSINPSRASNSVDVNSMKVTNTNKEPEEGEEEQADEDDFSEMGNGNINNSTGGSGNSNSNGKKRKQSSGLGVMASMRRLIDMEDHAPLCHLGETESNMFPKTVELMNHTIPVIYDSRVHIWFKADDFAKALGYKNYKSLVERYVNPNFILPYPNVLDLSRARYGDAFRLYSVNNKTAFINEAGAVQLLLRWLITGHSQQQRQQQTAITSTIATATNNTLSNGKQCIDESVDQLMPATVETNTEKCVKPPIVKPKLSADWIDYQLQPALLAFSNAAKHGKTAKDLRYEKAQFED